MVQGIGLKEKRKSAKCIVIMGIIFVAFSFSSQIEVDALIRPMYVGSGSLSSGEVDYWWVYSVEKGNLVLFNVVPDKFYLWESRLCYSNLTEIRTMETGGTHIYEFIANETDDYLLRLRAYSFGFNYDIQGSHSISEQSMYKGTSCLSEGEVDYWWISNVKEGNLVLFNIVPNEFYLWESQVYYSNLTEIKAMEMGDTHIHEFAADKSDLYLARLRAENFGFCYNISCSYPVTRQQLFEDSGSLSAGEVDYWWVSDVEKDDLILLYIVPDEFYLWESRMYYPNLTEIETIEAGGTHIHQFVADKTDNYLLRLRAESFGFNYVVKWCHPIVKHNVAITEVSLHKTVVCQGFSLNISINISNTGNFTQITNVTAYYNLIPIQTIIVENLVPYETRTITFIWNTAGVAKGNYTITAKANTVSDETNIKDNERIGGWVIVAMIGDITGLGGYPDGKCDMRDVGMVAQAFTALYNASDGWYWHPTPCNQCPHNPNCDITGQAAGLSDGKIDMRDVGLVAKHFGKIDP